VPDLLGADFGCSRPDAGGAAASTPGQTSDRRRAFAGDVAAHTKSLVALLDVLGLATVDLLGHSFGGFLVQVTCAPLAKRAKGRRVLVWSGSSEVGTCHGSDSAVSDWWGHVRARS
jgi:pimeloyl-ACP methyl ester carboxylesterase